MKKLILIACVLVLMGAGCDNRVCISSHEETGFRPAYMQPMMIGKTATFIIHPGYSYTYTVCDEYETPNP